MSTLTTHDYEQLLKFAEEINKHYDDFEYAVLDALAEHLNIQLSSYTIIDHTENGIPVIARNISRAIAEDTMDRYKNEIFKKDMFIQHFNRFRFTAMSANIFTSADFPAHTFQESDYGKFLASSNIGHQAVLGIKNTACPPSHTISIYKPLDSSGFTEHELELYKRISKIFNSTVARYKVYTKQKQLIGVMNGFANTLEHGFILLDQCNNILNYNDTFLTFSTQLSDEQDLSAIALNLIETVNSAAKKIDHERKIYEHECDGYTLKVSRKKLTTSTGVRKFTLLLINNKLPRTSTNNDTRMLVVAEYGLTSREAEIMLLMAKGLDNTEISDALFISMSTVKSHVRSIYSKLDVSTRTELLRKIRPITQPEG